MYGNRLIDANQSSDSVTDAVLTPSDPHQQRAVLTSVGSNLPTAAAGDLFFIAAGEWAEVNRGPYVIQSVDIATDQWTIRKYQGGPFEAEASGTITVQISQGFFEVANETGFQLEFISEVGGTAATIQWNFSNDGEVWAPIAAAQTAPGILDDSALPLEAARYINAVVAVIDTSVTIGLSSHRAV